MDRQGREPITAYSFEKIWCEAFVCREGVVQVGAAIDLSQQFTDRTGAKPMDVFNLTLAPETGHHLGGNWADRA